MLIFRWWSKYIKNAKLCAEFNGCIGIFYKRRNRAAIWFLLIWCFCCKIEYRRYRRQDEKKLARQSNQNDMFYPFCIIRSRKPCKTQRTCFLPFLPFSKSSEMPVRSYLRIYRESVHKMNFFGLCNFCLSRNCRKRRYDPTLYFTGNQYTKWISLVCAIFAFLEIVGNAGTTLLMYYTGNQNTKWKSLSSVCDLKIDHNCAR